VIFYSFGLYKCRWVASITNIGLLVAITLIYIQNLQLLKSYFTVGLVLVEMLFMIQNMVIIVFWFNLDYSAGSSIREIVDSAAPYLYFSNSNRWTGIAIFDFKTVARKIILRIALFLF
jgi:hypothetical protein